jgi:hypothetical protein
MVKKLLAFAVLAACCTAAGSLPLPAGTQGYEAVNNFLEQNIGLTSKPMTLAQLQLRLHATVKSSRQVQNTHVPGQMDRIVVLTDGKGTEVEAYVPATGTVIIQRIKVTDAGRKLPAGLVLGSSTLDDMTKALGENGTLDGPRGSSAWRYYNEEDTASVRLWFDRAGKLAGVEWEFSTGSLDSAD